MCGIAGILRFDGAPVSADEVRLMTDALVHRGPNDEGIRTAPGIGLGMRRLSIIDLATGRQPIANEDGTVWVVCNGEIYNFRELRAELEGKGHVFSCGSDVEVIVHLYEEHGARCLDRLRGMFALALWDARSRSLLLARDRLGIKPLFYAERGNTLLFASEVKGILPVLGESPQVDWSAADHLFRYLTTPPAQSIVAGVRKLEPGHLLLASAAQGGIAIRRWWQVRFEPDYGPTEAQWVEALRGALDESVRLHLVSDVPLGAFLSGGVDSSAVVASMAHSGEGDVRTFSIGFHEREFDELEYARLVANRFGTHHREEVLEPDVLGVLDDLAWYLDEPFGDCSAIPTYMVSRLAAREVTVVLSGDGGDELFAGYDRYLVERRERVNRFVPRPLRALYGAVGEAMPEGAYGREFLRHMAMVGAERYDDAGTLFKLDQRRKLYREDVFEAACGAGVPSWSPAAFASDRDWLSTIQRRDLEGYLPLDILTKVDRMSMANSIEARVPLLDHVLVELATRVPSELLLRGDTTKYIFKRALEGILPAAILERPKRGFAIPLGRWFRGQLGPLVRELLLSETSRARGWFDPAYIEMLLRLHQAGRPLDLQLWTLISFELWCRTFLDQGLRHSRYQGAAASPKAMAGGRDGLQRLRG